ncbi:MAG: bacillithiol biosynthesis cysteine-adding enzyme BshC [Cyclobacteriaceae bacterium]|jgi:bacillithiol biosynthesis cysteine-adding enzyme BshC
MKTTKTKLKDVGAFSEVFLRYLDHDEALKPFYRFEPTTKGLKEAVSQRKFSLESRLALYETLMEQYGPLERKQASFDNLISLKEENTFTVTTGHQLNIFSGPLYVIYKIISTINLAKKLQKQFPDKHFVPVYWMATEDHDFEEISSVNINGEKHTWKTEQKGPVGHFAPQSINTVLQQLPQGLDLFEKAYLDQSTLAESVRYYMHELFGDHGLVVVDADHARLKQLFAPIIKSDILSHDAQRLVEETNGKLSQVGLQAQAFAREINFFYLNGYRERITEKEGRFSVNNTDLTFSKEELLAHVDEHPERFSPNVIMRPMYQETVLPNLAYLGGPSELIYWLQLKATFEHHNVFYPVLLPRNFGMIINKHIGEKITRLKLPAGMIFKNTHDIKSWYLQNHVDDDFRLDAHRPAMDKLFKAIQAKAVGIDKSLEGFIGAEQTTWNKSVIRMEKKFKKALEKEHEISMMQIDAVKEGLFPRNGLQERHDNFLTYYLLNPDLLSALLDSFDPLDFSFYQFWEA